MPVLMLRLAVEDILRGTKMVAEGVRSSRVLLELAAAHGVDMPIVEQVVRVCHEGTPVDEALVALMSRSAKPEIR